MALGTLICHRSNSSSGISQLAIGKGWIITRAPAHNDRSWFVKQPCWTNRNRNQFGRATPPTKTIALDQCVLLSLLFSSTYNYCIIFLLFFVVVVVVVVVVVIVCSSSTRQCKLSIWGISLYTHTHSLSIVLSLPTSLIPLSLPLFIQRTIPFTTMFALWPFIYTTSERDKTHFYIFRMSQPLAISRFACFVVFKCHNHSRDRFCFWL